MANSKIEKQTTGFIERVGLMAQADGLPRIAGRLVGYFVMYGGPFSLSELAEKLQISRASVSTNGRLLAGLGILEKTTMPGERQDYYRLATSPYKQLIQGYIDRMAQSSANVADMEAVLIAENSNDAEMLSRVESMKNFYNTAIDNSKQLLELL